MIFKAIKLITNLYLHFVFIQVLKYLILYRNFVYGKREIETNEPQKKLSKISIVWVLFLFFLNFLNALNTIMSAI